jgi:hypothetical protein
MTRSLISTSSRHVNLGVAQAHPADAEPTVKAQLLRELAAWPCPRGQGIPSYGRARLLTADDLEAEASRIDPQQGGFPLVHRA